MAPAADPVGEGQRGRILITGARGLVGRHLGPALAAAGWSVTAGSRTRGIGFVELDVGDSRSVTRAMDGFGPDDAVVHLAAIAHRHRGVSEEAYQRVNVTGTANVLEEARRRGVGRIIVFSSAEVYGAQRTLEPVREDAPLRPVGPYARSKAAAERYCLDAVEAGAGCVVYRFPVIYAPEWLVSVRRRVYVPGTRGRIAMNLVGAQPRYSMCGLQAALDAVRFSLAGRVPPGIWNVADDRIYTHDDLRAALRLVDGSVTTLPVPNPAAPGLMRRLDWAPFVNTQVWELLLKLLVGYILDTSRLQALGWSGRGELAAAVAPRP